MPGGGDLELRRGLVIPASELLESASRSGGPGGQNVNKVNTRVTLRWDVAASEALTDAQRARLRRRLGARLTQRGVLVVNASRMRSRARNRELARERITELVNDGLSIQRSRTATGPTRSSKLKHRAAKQQRSRLKRGRAQVRADEE